MLFTFLVNVLILVVDLAASVTNFVALRHVYKSFELRLVTI
jgi:hypothetical protein